MRDLALDLKTGDLKNGAASMDEALLNNVYLSLTVPLGGWWAAPKFGNRLHLLQKEKLLPRVVKKAEGYCREALQWIITVGRAKTIAITAEMDDAGAARRVVCLISVTKNDGSKLDYTHFVRVG